MRFILFVLALISLSSCDMSNAGIEIFVVDIESVFASYDMQKELKDEVNVFATHRQGRLDSLASQVNILAESLDAQASPSEQEIMEYQQLFRLSAQEKAVYDSELQELIAKYDEMILKRINDALPKYAKTIEAELILTKGGAFPAALFSSESLEVTDAFIEFLNNEYSG